MNEKLKLVCDMLAVVGVSREEVVLLLKQLQEQWGIGIEEVMPRSEILERLRQIEVMCGEMKDVLRLIHSSDKKTSPPPEEKILSAGNTQYVSQEKPLEAKKARYSKNGKRLGRPPKSKSNVVNGNVNEILVAGAIDEAAEQGTETPRIHTETCVDGENVPSDNLPPPVFDSTIHLVEDETLSEVAELRMGKEYAYGIIYRYKPRLYVISHYVLRDLCPEAVCLNYGQAINGGYRKFAIATTDEIASVPLKAAKSYAANKLPKFEGEVWTVLNALQAGIAGREAKELNRLLNKIGGDPFRGKYATGSVLDGKIRYAINIK